MMIPQEITMAVAAAPATRRLSWTPIRKLCYQLLEDEVQDIRIGWCHSDYSRGDARMLIHALSQNTSVTTVNIGRKIVCFETLQALICQVAKLPRLRSLTLSMTRETILPESVLLQAVQCPTLQVLEIRHASIGRGDNNEDHTMMYASQSRRSSSTRDVVAGGHDRPTTTTTTRRRNDLREASPFVGSWLQHVSPSVTTLRLVGCGLRDDDLVQIAQFTQTHPLQELGLCFNQNIGLQGCHALCGEARIDRLDLTYCGLDARCAQAIADSISSDNLSGTGIQELVLAQNELIAEDHETFCHLARVCTSHLKHWDLSSCHLEQEQVKFLFHLLSGNIEPVTENIEITTSGPVVDMPSPLSSPPSTLESLTLRGLPTVDGPSTERLLITNKTLKKISLGRIGLEDSCLRHIEAGMEHNYTLKGFCLYDTFLSHPRIKLFLELNRLGRIVLRKDDPRDAETKWAIISAMLAKASKGALHWLLTNGAMWM